MVSLLQEKHYIQHLTKQNMKLLAMSRSFTTLLTRFGQFGFQFESVFTSFSLTHERVEDSAVDTKQ